jgi:hypothetical protein
MTRRRPTGGSIKCKDLGIVGTKEARELAAFLRRVDRRANHQVHFGSTVRRADAEPQTDDKELVVLNVQHGYDI